MIDTEEIQKEAHEKECENEPEPKCEWCKDTGMVTKTEWADDDRSYDVTARCVCQED